MTRAGTILSELKTLYRNDETRVEPIALNTIIQNAVLVMNPFIRKANIRLDIVGLDALVMSSTGKLEQVFINLMSNSVDALALLPDGVIEVAATHPRQRGGEICRQWPGDHRVRMTKSLNRSIRPSLRVKGWGLGLAISKFIVDAIGGKIECHNLSTGGLEFIIVLRHADKPT